MPDIDPFAFFRSLLFVFLTVYYALAMWMTVARFAALLRGDHPTQRMMRILISYHMVTIRLRPLAGELTQIGLLTVLLAGIWWAHTQI